MLTVADLHGAGAANAGTTVTVYAGEDANRAKVIAESSQHPKSPSMAALLAALETLQQQFAAYRVAVVNATEPTNQAEVSIVVVRQKVLAAEVTEQDPVLRAKVSTIVMTIDGVLDRFRDVHRQLSMIEIGLRPLESSMRDVLEWGHAIGYPSAPQPSTEATP